VRTILPALIGIVVLSAFGLPLAAQTSRPIYLYSLVDQGAPNGALHVFSVNASTGALTEVPGSPFTAGLDPANLVVDPSGRFVYVINRGSNDITAFSVNGSTGALTQIPGSPFPLENEPGLIAIDPTGRFLYVYSFTINQETTTSNIDIYTIDSATGVLTAAAGSPISEPAAIQSITFDPIGNYAYLGEEPIDGAADEILICTVDVNSGLLTQVGTVQPASLLVGQSIIAPGSQFLYSAGVFSLPTNYADGFTIDPNTGLLNEVTGSPYEIGENSFQLASDPSGKFLYVVNAGSPYQITGSASDYAGTISAFTIDSKTGALTGVVGSPFAAGINAISVIVDPTGRFTYAASTRYVPGTYDSSATILGYSVNSSSGVLTPFPATAWTDSAAFDTEGNRLAIAYAGPATSNPVPLISTLSPSSATAGGAGFTLQVIGSNFVQGATVYFGGRARNTAFVNSNELNADILTSDIADGGTGVVFVFNPLPGGGASTSVEFNVFNPTPVISSLSPSSVVAGANAFNLTVNGSNFVTSSVVSFNGAARSTIYVSPAQLTAAILATDIPTQGTAAIVVTNPPSSETGGGISDPATLTILPANVQPTVGNLSPASATAGGPAFTLTLSGNGFVQGSQVSFNLNNVTTTFVSSTELQAAIPASAIAIAGNPYVIVTNPGGVVSVLTTFTVNNPSPTGGSVAPPSLPAGSNALTLSVSGSGFTPGSVVLVNGSSRITTYISSTLLQATLLPSDLAAGATLNITVSNPPPGGGTTVAITFAVADYTITPPTLETPVEAGQTDSFTLAVAPSNGTFSSPVTFSVVTQLPAGASASFSPSATITPGASPQTVTLFITTTPHSAAFVINFPRGSGPANWLFLALAGAALALAGIVLRASCAPIRHPVPQLLLAALLIVTAGMVACSGGGIDVGNGIGTVSPPVPLNPATGTPAGTYPLVVTATSGGVSHSITVTLTVM